MEVKKLKDAYDFIKTYYTVNAELLELADRKRMAECLQTLQREIRRPAPIVAERIEECYAPLENRTFIMRHTYADCEPIKSECVGWYHGEPNPLDTAAYIDSLVAEY